MLKIVIEGQTIFIPCGVTVQITSTAPPKQTAPLTPAPKQPGTLAAKRNQLLKNNPYTTEEEMLAFANGVLDMANAAAKEAGEPRP